MPEATVAPDPHLLARQLADQLGGRVRELRLRLGLSTEELGRRPGLTGPTIRDIEAKKDHMRRLDTLVALALALGLNSLDELFGAAPGAVSQQIEEHWNRKVPAPHDRDSGANR